MTPQEFDETLIRFKHREPFVPFVVELLDGTIIPINGPEIAICEGRSTYFGFDSGFVDLASEEVREIREAPRGDGMTQQEFEDKLREFVRREPFEPFVVELLDGRSLS